jgi:hypothetical protein
MLIGAIPAVISNLKSILAKIYDQLLCQYSFSKKLQSQAVSREKLHKKHFHMKKLLVRHEKVHMFKIIVFKRRL